MRVALLAAFPMSLVPGFENAPGGNLATWLPQLSEAFATATEYDIHWLNVSRRPVPAAPVRWRGQTFHCLHSPARGRIYRAYRPDRALIHERLNSINPDLVHAWGTEDCYALAAATSGRPWLLSVQGLLQEYLRRCPMPLLTKLQAHYERMAFEAATEITAESDWAMKAVAQYAPHARLHHIDYGVQATFFAATWNPEPPPAAIFVGTPEPRKGLQDAVTAFAEPRLAGAQLQIVGTPDNSFARDLWAQATPNVRWLGRMTQAETAAALARAWCLVIPTRADTGPTVVKEARVVGLPVVTTPDGGQSGYITDGVNGFQVPTGDVPALVEKLSLLLGDLAQTRAMGAARQEEQREYFRPERTAAAFLKLYRELHNKR